MTTPTDSAISVLCAALADDPVFAWLLADAPAGVEMADLLRPAVEQSAAQDELTHQRGEPVAAAWLRRGAEPLHHEGQLLPDGPARLVAFAALVDERYPAGWDHLYLAFLGVLPPAQGTGLGGRLLGERLAQADADQVPVYLEASSPRNRLFYQRHGFGALGPPITLPDGPQLYPMWRDPRP